MTDIVWISYRNSTGYNVCVSFGQTILNNSVKIIQKTTFKCIKRFVPNFILGNSKRTAELRLTL